MTDAIRKGKIVSVTYTPHDERGEIFDVRDATPNELFTGQPRASGVRLQ